MARSELGWPPEGELWRLDKAGRWRSKVWLQWVRGLHCCCGLTGCMNCAGWDGTGPDRVEAAHWRYSASVGMGLKPDDFFVYPLSAKMHSHFHAHGQPSRGVQQAWMLDTWKQAQTAGVLVAASQSWDMSLDTLINDPRWTAAQLALAVRQGFKSGGLVLRDPFFSSLPF